jgi:hypothetical protein
MVMSKETPPTGEQVSRVVHENTAGNSVELTTNARGKAREEGSRRGLRGGVSSPMTKSEQRRDRKAAAAAGRPWNIETAASGHLEIVCERTQAEERRHAARMDRWARRQMDSDPDWR